MKNKITVRIAIIILMAILCTAMLSPVYAMSSSYELTSSIISEPTDPPGRTISISGTGSVNLIPDIAHVNVGVHTENADIVKSIDTNNETSQKIKGILVKYGIDEKDIQTSNFSVYTNNQYNSGQPSTFAVDNTLSITVRDLNQLSKLLGEVTRNGANNINGIQFDLSDKSKALSEARKLAYEDARAQATEMADILGASLGNVIDAKVTIGSSTQPFGYGMGGGGETAKAINVPISTGQLVISVNLDVTYEIK